MLLPCDANGLHEILYPWCFDGRFNRVEWFGVWQKKKKKKTKNEFMYGHKQCRRKMIPFMRWQISARETCLWTTSKAIKPGPEGGSINWHVSLYKSMEKKFGATRYWNLAFERKVRYFQGLFGLPSFKSNRVVWSSHWDWFTFVNYLHL